MDEMLADILDVCLARLEAGASVEACLADYPDQSGALEGPLLMATGLRGLPRPAMPATTRGALESRMLALAAARRVALPATQPATHSSTTRPMPWHSFDPAATLAGVLRSLGYRGPLAQPWLRLASAMLAVVLALVLGVGAFAAARVIINRALPQPPRLVPAATAVSTPSPQSFAFTGPIEQINQEGWIVGGTLVALDSQTAITGVPALGMTARISGVVQANGVLLARNIAITGPTSAPTSALPAPTSAPTLTPPTAVPTLAPPPQPQPGGESGGDSTECKDKGKEKDKGKCKPKPHDEKDHKDEKHDD